MPDCPPQQRCDLLEQLHIGRRVAILREPHQAREALLGIVRPDHGAILCGIRARVASARHDLVRGADGVTFMAVTAKSLSGEPESVCRRTAGSRPQVSNHWRKAFHEQTCPYR